MHAHMHAHTHALTHTLTGGGTEHRLGIHNSSLFKEDLKLRASFQNPKEPSARSGDAGAPLLPGTTGLRLDPSLDPTQHLPRLQLAPRTSGCLCSPRRDLVSQAGSVFLPGRTQHPSQVPFTCVTANRSARRGVWGFPECELLMGFPVSDASSLAPSTGSVLNGYLSLGFNKQTRVTCRSHRPKCLQAGRV